MDELITALIKQLDSLYPGVDIYREKIEQGATTPYFFVHEVNTMQDRGIDRRRMREYTIDLMYFDTKNKDMDAMGERLLDQLEMIDMNGRLIRCNNFQQNITDGVHHTIMDFNIHLLKVIPIDPLMQDYIATEKVVYDG